MAPGQKDTHMRAGDLHRPHVAALEMVTDCAEQQVMPRWSTRATAADATKENDRMLMCNGDAMPGGGFGTPGRVPWCVCGWGTFSGTLHVLRGGGYASAEQRFRVCR